MKKLLLGLTIGMVVGCVVCQSSGVKRLVEKGKNKVKDTFCKR